MIDALKTADILLPKPGIDLTKWAVVACDQFTAQPEYWRKVEQIVGDAPSGLRMTLPEIWLSESEQRIPRIHRTMQEYLDEGILQTAVNDGFVLVCRETGTGPRPGLMVCLDLDQYDFNPGSGSLIRPTEGTVVSRVPPRARIRAGAPVELPHVMMLIDDPGQTVIEPLLERRETLRPLYDLELMQSGGRLRGWAVEGNDVEGVYAAIHRLEESCGGLLYAVGDGNHSLAAAKQCWLDIREHLTPEQREGHPARYAMVELVNLACPALIFEPIHRVVFHVDTEKLMAECAVFLREKGAEMGEGDDLVIFDQAHTWRFRYGHHPLRLLQSFLDDYIARHTEAEIDYIHGDDALKALVARGDAVGFMPRAFDKSELFPYIRKWGVLPRKTFSMGEANEKRYYMEARRLLPE